MNRNAKRFALRMALAPCLVLLSIGAFLVARYQHYRISKIEFLIWDNQHENVAALSREQFADYLQQCGAQIDSSSPQWTVRYDGLFDHKSWSFPFVTSAGGAP